MNDSAIVFYNLAGRIIHEEPMEFRPIRFDCLEAVWGNARACRLTLGEYPCFIAIRINGVARFIPELEVSRSLQPGMIFLIREGALSQGREK